MKNYRIFSSLESGPIDLRTLSFVKKVKLLLALVIPNSPQISGHELQSRVIIALLTHTQSIKLMIAYLLHCQF